MRARPTGYNIISYGNMVNCEPRTAAYVEALRQAVTPGCTVIDLGSGPGVFAVLACKFGAGRAIAIDPSDSVELIGPIAEANGCGDRITVIKELSTNYIPTHKADVIVADLRGMLPLFEGLIPTLIDARERMLAPGGTMIPMRDVLNVALVESPESYRPYAEPWSRNLYDIDLRAGSRFAVNQLSKVALERDRLLAGPHEMAVLDYAEIASPDVAGTFDLEAERNATAHGLLVWFDAELAPGIRFSNAPGEPRQVYGQTFFPFERPMDLDQGDRVTGEIAAKWLNNTYVWTWSSRFARGTAEPQQQFRQSTFLSAIIDPTRLKCRDGTFAPEQHPLQAIDRYCLTLIDGKRTLHDIANEVAERFAGAFPEPADALDHVAELVSRYE